MYAAHVHQLRRDHHEAEKWAQTALHLARGQGYLYNAAFAEVILGWAQAVRGGNGGNEEGLALIREGLATASAIGAKLDQPYLLALAAESCLASGHSESALDLIAEALSLVEASRAFFYEAELYRLRGLAHPSADAEDDLRRSQEVARRQGAVSLQLRAAADLARHLMNRGRIEEAKQNLQPVYAAFKEGFDTKDLQDAKSLLDQLGSLASTPG
jgi:adenylate cyclase